MAEMPVAFEQRQSGNGLSFLHCTALRVPHGFSLRQGGVSRGPWSSLNLGASAGDDPACVTQNKALWSDAFGLEAPPLTLHQVHGALVYSLVPQDDTEPGARQGDALVNACSDRAIGVYTADCVPLLLATNDGHLVSAVHAGWRGTVAEVAVRAVEAMQAAGAQPEDIVVALGPAIGPCCFAVGAEVVSAFADATWFDDTLVHRANGHACLDLFLANRLQLLGAGLREQNIHTSDLCTVCHPDKFFSWRRDQGQTGRHMAVIQRRPLAV